MKLDKAQTVTNEDFDFVRAKPMHNSDGIGYTVIRTKNLQIDRVYFAPGSGVDTHVHEAIDHVLEVRKGTGKLMRGSTETHLKAGIVYEVLSGIEHAIKASTEGEFGLDLQVTSNGWMNIDSDKRLKGGGSIKKESDV